MENNKEKQRLGTSGWITIIVLAGLLVAAVVYAANAWTALNGTAMSGAGWFFLVLGVIFTIGVGGGLMWLVFYSSRHHYDR